MKMKVELLSYTKDCEKLIATSAKLCYSQVGIKELVEKEVNEEETDIFLKKLMDVGHESPIEHANFTFGVEGVSRALTHQLVRHRIASYSQQSQRYVKITQFEYVVPPSIEKNLKAKKIYRDAMEEIQKKYEEVYYELYKDNLKEELSLGIKEEVAKRNAEKKSLEDSRYLFPNACETKIIFTMNTRSLLNFLRHRTCLRAQWEIRYMAIEMLRILKEISPTLFKKAGPPCVSGPCTEGVMTCGKIKEVREYYKTLE